MVDELMRAVGAARAAGAEGWPVAVLNPVELPLTLAVEVMAAMCGGLEDAGFRAFLREETGLGVIWVDDTSRRRTTSRERDA